MPKPPPLSSNGRDLQPHQPNPTPHPRRASTNILPLLLIVSLSLFNLVTSSPCCFASCVNVVYAIISVHANHKKTVHHHDIINLPLPSPSSHHTPLPPPPTIHPTRHHTSSHQPSHNQRRMLLHHHHHRLQLSQLQRHSSQRLCQMRWILVCGL